MSLSDDVPANTRSLRCRAPIRYLGRCVAGFVLGCTEHLECLLEGRKHQLPTAEVIEGLLASDSIEKKTDPPGVDDLSIGLPDACSLQSLRDVVFEARVAHFEVDRRVDTVE